LDEWYLRPVAPPRRVSVKQERPTYETVTVYCDHTDPNDILSFPNLRGLFIPTFMSYLLKNLRLFRVHVDQTDWIDERLKEDEVKVVCDLLSRLSSFQPNPNML
jgi:hypothetical protein